MQMNYSSIFATLEKKRVHGIQENGKNGWQPKISRFYSEKNPWSEEASSCTRCYGATLIRRIRTHDFDINFSDINDIRNVQSTHH